MSAPLLDLMKTFAASSGLMTEKLLGDTGVYTSAGGSVAVYLTAGGVNGNISNILGVRANKDKRKFWISVQTGFPPDGGPSGKHTITYRGQIWVVLNANNQDGIGQRFEVDTVLTTGLSIQ